MKFLTLLFVLFSFAALAQIPVPKKADSCYKRSNAGAGRKFAEWECGKIAGVVDCNEKLTLDPDSKLVMSGSSFKPFTGQCETCHMNGRLERRVTFVNGKSEGIDTTNYQSGCIQVIRSHIQGVENGKWTYFYDSLASPTWEKNYSLGQPHGDQINFAKNGDTTKLETYTDGVLNGPKVSYYPGNKRMKVVNYKNGLMEGAFLIYNPQGIIIEELSYHEGKKNGVLKYYYDDGKLLRTENWEMDAKNGEFKTLFTDGTMQSVEVYKKSSGKPVESLTADVYECATEEDAEKVAELLAAKKTFAEIKEELGESAVVTLIEEQGIDMSQRSYLKGRKISRGINKPYKSDGKYYVVNGKNYSSIARKEVREGWFEERYQDQKVKRRALYQKDVLIEEHVFDEQGRETYTFGGKPKGGAEDDAVPGTEKAKKEKKKKETPPPAQPEGE